MALTACTSVGRCASETSIAASAAKASKSSCSPAIDPEYRVPRQGRATPVCRHPWVSRRSMHRGDGTERRIVFDRQDDAREVDARQFPRSGRRQRGNRAQPQLRRACLQRRRESRSLPAGACPPRLARMLQASGTSPAETSTSSRAGSRPNATFRSGSRWASMIQLDRQLDAAERKVVGGRLAGQNGLRPDFFASRLGQSQPATGPASQLQSPAVETGSAGPSSLTMP